MVKIPDENTGTIVYISAVYKPFTPKHQYAYSPYCSLYFSWVADKENLFSNQELLGDHFLYCHDHDLKWKSQQYNCQTKLDVCHS